MSRKLDLVLTGTGRCATAFYARYLSSAGLACGHERFFSYQGLDHALKMMRGYWAGTRAECSWLAAPFLDSEPLKDALVVHLIRHPKEVIESWLRVSIQTTPEYWDFLVDHMPRLARIENEIDRWAERYVSWNRLVEENAKGHGYVRFDVGRDPIELLRILAEKKLIDLEAVDPDELFQNRTLNTKVGHTRPFWPERVRDQGIRDELVMMCQEYGYIWPARQTAQVQVQERVRVVLAALDNLSILEKQIALFREDPLVHEVVAVNNGSVDGTREYLDGLGPAATVYRDGRKDPVVQKNEECQEPKLTAVHWASTVGAGPARNSGIDAPGQWDYIEFLDGGISPLVDGTARMYQYLQRTPKAHVIGVEIADFRTDPLTAWTRWPEPITRAYQNLRLSHTAYCLARAKALDGIRFCEEEPFFAVGWGADDDEMMCRWRAAGIVVHVVTCACKLGAKCSGVHPYRRASGSWAGILKKTGVSATGYGSAYEARCVYLGQEWPQYEHNNQWGEPWLTVVVQAGPDMAQMVMMAHDLLRKRRFQVPHSHVWNPYSVVVWATNPTPEENAWLEAHRLRQHHGTVAFYGDKMYRKAGSYWTGDFRVWNGNDWQESVRPGAYYYGLVKTPAEVTRLIDAYNETWPPKLRKNPPPGGGRTWLTI